MSETQQSLKNQLIKSYARLNDKLGELIQVIKIRIPQPHSQQNNSSLSICQKIAIFLVILVIGRAFIYVSKDHSSIQHQKKVFEVQEKFSKQQDLKKINSLIQSLKQPLKIDLYERKFFKDAVYDQMKQIVKDSHKQISLVSGKNVIGKTTSILKILNKKRSKIKEQDKIDMTLYFSLSRLQNLQQFNKLVLYSQVWQLVKNWNSLEEKYQSLNSVFKNSFSKQPLLVVIDQANQLNQFCQKKCPFQIKSFLKDLKTLASNGASIILLSNNPNFDYMDNISGLRSDYFQIFQIISQNDKALRQMIRQFNINKKILNLLLQNFNQKGRIIYLISKVQNSQQPDKEYRQKINSQLKWFINKIQDAINKFSDGWEQRENIFMNICRQKQLSNEFVTKYKHQIRQFGKSNILYKTDFSYRLYLRAFERYYQQQYPQKNQVEKIRCIQRLPQMNDQSDQSNIQL